MAAACEQAFRINSADPDNLGASRLELDSAGSVRSVPIDKLISADVNFIKIDVEGMEMEVLEGAAGLIQRWRPKLMVEVAKENRSQFLQWLETNSYAINREFIYVNATNIMVAPKSEKSNA